MKKNAIITYVLILIISTNMHAQKGVHLAIQYNSSTIKYAGTTPAKYLGTGFGIGVNLNKKVGFLDLAIDPRLMLYSHRTNNNSKTQYIQVPISINLLSFAGKFIDDEINVGSVKKFQFGLNVGLYGAYAIGGKFNGSTKFQFGEGATDTRSPLDFGLHTNFSFGSNMSSFRGFLQVQRGLKNVIPSARVNNDSRKLNGVNVGCSFRIKR